MKLLWLGIDIGSTTVKISVIDPETRKTIYSKYERHNAKQPETVHELLIELLEKFPGTLFKAAICGSGGGEIASFLNIDYIQEVVANAIAVKEYYPQTKVAIELGGQDAKVIFFHKDEKTGQIMASDMRMNGSCAGGTGAFIDQMAELLNINPADFGNLALKGKMVYDISGRCGVFAKTDIQPLLNQGVPKEDIALSSFHAIAKQTIGGLAQGAEIHPPVIFEGGPLTFNRKLIDVFIERLSLKENEAIVPEHPETIVATGAALSIGIMFNDSGYFNLDKAVKLLEGYRDSIVIKDKFEIDQYFNNEEESKDFFERHKVRKFIPKAFKEGETVEAYLGIDAGSTTSKFVLLDENENIIDKFYANNAGEPLTVVKNALIKIREKYKEQKVNLIIKGVGTTGYGELLFSKAFKADYHNVETVSHAEAAMKYAPGVSFIMDIGGQDMKAISIKNGIVTGIVLNEACSAGCGSFIETYARSLKTPVDKIAEMAFKSEKPSRLGSRCTVFMNSCIVTEQRNGKTPSDIMAGLCRSVIDNVFTKVVRMPNFDMLGNIVVVQGGTFKNDAVLRAMEQYTGRKVIRPEHPGEMGAIGIALLTKKFINEQKNKKEYNSTFIGLDTLDSFTFEKHPGNICQFCTNNCNRTVIEFSDGSYYVTGNRCERGEIIGDLKDASVRNKLKEKNDKSQAVPDMFKVRNELLFEDYKPKVLTTKRNMKIGIPRVLEFWNSYPFWNAFFTSLGFEVVLSDKSTYRIFEEGLKYVPSDTACFPAKLVHGHIENLIDKKVDRIFYPMMMEIPTENENHPECFNMCVLIQAYALVTKENNEPEKRSGVVYDSPTFRWYNKKLRNKQLIKYVEETFGLHKDVVVQAITEGDKADKTFRNKMLEEGSKIIKSLEGTNKFAVVLAGRPYHGDELVNHDLSKHFTTMGIPVLTLDSLPGIYEQNLNNIRTDTVNPFHTRLFSGSVISAKHPNLEIVQIVSFGCGHDAINTDEMIRITAELSDKQVLILKLDEGEAKGPVGIRIRSFIETIKARRKNEEIEKNEKELAEPFTIKFEKKDIKDKTILIPNLSEGFTYIVCKVLERMGYTTKQMPVADARAKELGKKYVHNDICFPAQINIGEVLSAIEKGLWDPDNIVLGLAKNCDACRAGQYMALARKALDEAGYPQIPIITTGSDNKNAHPGFKMGIRFQLGMLVGLSITDVLEDMRRRIRPYEVNKGQTNELFDKWLKNIGDAILGNYLEAFKLLDKAVEDFNNIPVVTEKRKPRVFIIGEILLNYHPSANERIIEYFEENGMETILPPLVDFFRRDLIRIKEGVKKHHINHPFLSTLIADLTDDAYEMALNRVEKSMKKFRYYEKRKNVHDLSDNIADLVDKSFMSGEGWMIPAEIIEHASHGVNSFVIVQPFGCLPNHVSGRGIMKYIKKKYPDVQIVSIDYDPDISFANVENRLQMLIMAAKETETEKLHVEMTFRPSTKVR